MNSSFPTGLEDVRESLRAELTVDVYLRDAIRRSRRHLELRERELEALSGRGHFEGLAAIVYLNTGDLHSRPSPSSCSIKSRILRDAIPFIAVSCSRSHFTIAATDLRHERCSRVR